MDRKSFLKTFGLVAVTLVGVRGLTNMLMAPVMKDKNKPQGPTGFGTGKFGV